MFDMSIPQYLSEAQTHLISITGLFFITWIYTLHPKWSFCIDDIEGVAKFSDRFIQTKDANGNIVKEEKIDYYEQEIDGKPVKIGNFKLNKTLGFPNCF